MSSSNTPSRPSLRSVAEPLAAQASGYSTREVAELIGLPVGRIRHYARRRLVAPERGQRNEYRFGFRDVVVLRNAKRLIDGRVSARTTLRSLLGLLHGAQNTDDALNLVPEGERVLVSRDGGLWDLASGQGELDFSAPRRVASVTALNADSHLLARQKHASSSDDWYNLGLDLEDLDLDRAMQAYRRALELDPRNADAHVNLGRLLQLDGDLDDARDCYHRALAVEPEHQLASYNLGTVYDEQECFDEAAGCYLNAPIVADAHYNLARLCELKGDELSARRHLRRYRVLLESSS